MAQSAMSASTWDGKWEPFSSKLDEWLYFKDEFDNKEVNDPSLKLTRHEVADRILHDIEDLGRSNSDGSIQSLKNWKIAVGLTVMSAPDDFDWLDEFPLFEEIQTLKSAEDFESENCSFKFEQEQASPNDVLVVPEIHKQSLANTDLFSVSNENAATFLLSNDNVLYIKNESFVTLGSLQPGYVTANKPVEEKISCQEPGNRTSENINIQPEFSWANLDTPDVKIEMAMVDEIIRNTALGLDHWESDSSRSETSSDSLSASDLSPKEKEEESDDPDWKPDSLELGKRKCSIKRSKSHWRGGSQEEKKLRKKEQNKNAATRYRQKKKAEVNEILREEESLREKKAKLEEKVTDIQSEIKCLKALMRDLFKAKGIID